MLAIRRQMPRLGTRKLYYLLKDNFRKDGIRIGRDRLFDLLRQEGLLVTRRKKYIKTTDSRHWMHKYPNLIKGLAIKRPEQLWVADITYVAVGDDHCYLHLITDVYSKLIVGHHVSESLAASGTVKALKMALKNRQYTGRIIHHSDRGLQYCSTAYVKVLNNNQIAISMTENGSPYDNPIAERINGILKDEFGLDDVFNTLQQLQAEVIQSVNIYNNQRPHESNHMLTPKQMHKQNKLKPKAWHKKSTRTLKGSCGFLPSLQHS